MLHNDGFMGLVRKCRGGGAQFRSKNHNAQHARCALLEAEIFISALIAAANQVAETHEFNYRHQWKKTVSGPDGAQYVVHGKSRRLSSDHTEF